MEHRYLATNLGRPARIWAGTRVFERLCHSPDWAAETKKQGWRCLAITGKVEMWSRRGKPIAKSYPKLHAALAALPPAKLDGELLIKCGQLWVFDILQIGDDLCMRQPYWSRRAMLEKFLKGGNGVVRLMPMRLFDKEEMYNEALESGDEGVVFKHMKRAYPLGETYDWIKARVSLLDREEAPKKYP
jgi:ATP-dependent DNA ligase